MAEDPLIRDAERSDAERIRTVAREGWHAAYDDILGEDTVDTVVDEWYESDGLHAAIDETLFFIADLSDDLVGFVNARQYPERDDGSFELVRIYVCPDHWNRGIGSRLLETVTTAIINEGGNRLRLFVLADNEVGVAFYESHGFERLGEAETALDGDSYREYEYGKRLR
ncbi:GNAT family N-acetyltransferase [Natrinema altunense]|uniref:GNAT family N-acetyltransferase n=1 Tax=Natrinema altunense TaxID=222984 RepID=A0A482Y3N6_9EURY|nr:GNAT family N-acetyltransferase [Natrinema altunense]RZH69490.1 GNAT family N-acetyltransferase [Natrinema altunense]